MHRAHFTNHMIEPVKPFIIRSGKSNAAFRVNGT
jgi:hypothetical protein